MEIDKKKLAKIIREEYDNVLSEQLDHAGIRDVVTHASKLLAAVENFKNKASETMNGAVSQHVEALAKSLEDMISTPGSYVLAPKKEPKKVSLKAVKPSDD